MRKILSGFICVCLVLGMSVCAFADGVEYAGEARTVIGASLTDEQTASVYEIFGIERGGVKELSVTNAEERSYLEGLVDASVIGTNSISCIYLEILSEGEGLQIETSNITWCSKEMFINALVTAGIDDAKIIVAAPFEVSGTAALTGIYKAYEDITGEAMDDIAKLVSTQELVVTSALADEIGSYDAVTIVNEIKLILDETKKMSDDEIKDEISSIAGEYGVTFTDGQMSQLIDLCRALEKMDGSALKEKVEYVQNTVKKLAEAQEKVAGITETVKNVVTTITEFVNNILNFFRSLK